MRAKGMPFVVYRRGDFFTFVPRGPKGWVQLAIWIALIVPSAVWFADHLESAPAGADFHFGLLLFLASAAAWLIGGLWWLFAHAEVIDMTVLLRDRQRAERKKQRRDRAE